ncbi:B12 binding domain protein [uncultured archaeon]|nr:B12 binding domain protein [uncultured archaeon]
MKKVDIVFIDPPNFSSQNLQKVNNKPAANLPNLGICILAAVLEREGYSVAIIDAGALQYSYKQILDGILVMNPRYVGLTAMTHSIGSAASIANLIKKKQPDIKIILGGVHITSATEETFKKYPACFDVAVIGEGESTIVELLQALENGGGLDKVSGLAFLNDGRVVRTKPREIIENIDTLPFPAWHLLPDMHKYYRPSLISAGNISSSHLVTSRGCPGKCIFCDTTVNGHIVRGYSADYVIQMIEILHTKYKINDIQFNDDTFVTLRKRLYDICDRLIEKKYHLTWSCDARASDVTEEGLKLMKAAGCWQIAFGIETGSKRIMDFLQKRVTYEQIHNAVSWAKKAGISTKGFFILGHPTETRESIQETLDLMLSLDLDVVGVTFFTAYPGSPIYRTIRDYGEFDSDWDKVNTYEVGNFIPRGFTAEELTQIRINALQHFYFRPKQILKYISNIRSPYQFFRLLTGGCKIVYKSIFPS